MKTVGGFCTCHARVVCKGHMITLSSAKCIVHRKISASFFLDLKTPPKISNDERFRDVVLFMFGTSQMGISGQTGNYEVHALVYFPGDNRNDVTTQL